MKFSIGVHQLTNKKALRIFVHDATKVASKMSRTIPHGDTGTLCLFVNEETGRVAMWCRADDPAAYPMSVRHDILYDLVPWQIRGNAKEDENGEAIHKRF
jgi:hypothetical protein